MKLVGAAVGAVAGFYGSFVVAFGTYVISVQTGVDLQLPEFMTKNDRLPYLGAAAGAAVGYHYS